MNTGSELVSMPSMKTAGGGGLGWKGGAFRSAHCFDLCARVCVCVCMPVLYFYLSEFHTEFLSLRWESEK